MIINFRTREISRGTRKLTQADSDTHIKLKRHCKMYTNYSEL
jgi:hypothetical protein